MSIKVYWAEFDVSGGGLVARFSRPVADAAAGTWVPSTGTTLFDMIDEDPADDLDYISTSTASTCDINLQPVEDPGTSSGQIINIRAKSAIGSSLIATLKQGTTTIATRTFTSLAASFTVYQIELTSGECDAITDYSSLHITLEAV